MGDDQTARYRANWQDEVESAYLYRALAKTEHQPQLAEVYKRLADAEAEHAAFWAARLETAGQPVGQPQIGWRTRTLAILAQRFGSQFVLPTITSAERADSSAYRSQTEAGSAAMASEERSHARLLQTIVAGTPGGMEGSVLAQLEGRHRASSGGNALRAAVLGASDGLLSNLSLVMGVAGASPTGNAVLIAGLAGLLAGAFSMALGEWISVQSSRELYERQIRIERDELAQAPQEEENELSLIYQAKGLPEDVARDLARRLVADPATALDTLAREELGIDPGELGGSAWQAALTSFFLFAIGAIIPVAPFLFLAGWTAIGFSLVLSTLGLFGIGAAITLLTGRSVWFSGMRQVVIGLAAAGMTFLIGRLIGASVGG